MSTIAYSPSNSERLRAAAPVAVVHALLALALLRGLGFTPGAAAAETLKLFNIAPPPPAVPDPAPSPAPSSG